MVHVCCDFFRILVSIRPSTVMDLRNIRQYIREKDDEFCRMSGDLVIQRLDDNMREIKRLQVTIFQKRMDYFVLAGCLHRRMEVESGHKQLKRYLVQELGMDDREATLDAQKYNKAYRTLKKFDKIVENVSRCPNIEIEDLTISQLHLAVRESWVKRFSAMHGRVEPKVPGANPNGMDVDWGEVDASFRQLQASNWYQKAKNSPAEMAHVMNSLGDRAVQDAVYHIH